MDADEDLDQLEALANSIDDSSSSSSDSEDESMEIDKKYIAKEITIGIEKDELDTSSEIEDSNDIEPEKEKNPTNATSDNIVCVDMPGITSESLIMTDIDIKDVNLIEASTSKQNVPFSLQDVSISTLASADVSMSSDVQDSTSTFDGQNSSLQKELISSGNKIAPTPAQSMQSLQEMFENIEEADVVENVENVETHELLVDVIENKVDNATAAGTSGAGNDQSLLFSDYSIDDIIGSKVNDDFVNDNIEDNDENEDDDDYESEESSSDEELENDFTSLYELCDNYIENLNNMLQMMQKELERNLSRQREIDLEISDLQLSNLAATKNKNQHKIISRKPLSIFASPYFKDKHLYHPPPNEDTRRKGLNKELNVWIDYPIPFKEEERRKLKIYVKEDAVRKKSLRLRQEKEKIEAKLNSFIFDEEMKEVLNNQLEDVHRQIDDIRRLPDDKMFSDRFEEYDWTKISVTNFNSVHSPKECELQWQNLVHPSINRSSFSPEEDKLLRRLAEALQAQDWDAIAREMETGRTPHACFVRYMTRHNVVINNRKWEKSEDDRLRRLIAHCRINNFIPWTKVSFYMDRRTKDQCFQRYVYSLKDIIRKGPFTDAEDMLLIIGEKLYKNDWAKINEMIPCRTPIQLHCRFNHFIKGEHRNWTEEEDIQLLEQVRKHGLRDWVLVASAVGGDRTRSQCRARFQFIYKCFKKNPTLALGSIDYKDNVGVSKRRQEEVFDKLSERFEEWKEAEVNEGVFDNDTETQVNDAFAHVQLPNGELINRRSLTRFIRYIQAFLPKADPPRPLAKLENKSTRTLPKREEELFKRPLTAPSSLQPKKKRFKIDGYNHKQFKTYKSKKPAYNREKLGKSNFRTVVDRNIAKFFRPTWILKHNSLNTFSYRYNDTDLDILSAGGHALGNILKMKKLVPDDDDRDCSLIHKINQLSEKSSQNIASFSPSATSSPKVPKTYGRTYSRKQVKQSLSRSATPNDNAVSVNTGNSNKDQIDFIPPSVSTLVGFRGVLLTNSYLADPNNHSETFKQEKDVVDVTVEQGINNPDVVTIQEDENITNKEHLEADQLLLKRFIQLFFWPAKMSSFAPSKQESLFDDDDEQENC